MEEERSKIDQEKKLESEMRGMREEEEKRQKEEARKELEEEKRVKMEEERSNIEQGKKLESDMREEEEKRQKEEARKELEEEKRVEESEMLVEMWKEEEMRKGFEKEYERVTLDMTKEEKRDEERRGEKNLNRMREVRQTEEEGRLNEEDERKTDEREKIEGGGQQQEETKRQSEGDDSRKTEGGIKLKEALNRKMATPTFGEKKQQTMEMEERLIEGEEGNRETEERRLKIEENSKQIIIQDKEKEVKGNNLQENRENNTKKYTDMSEEDLASHSEDSTLSSSSPRPPHRVSTISLISAETVQQHGQTWTREDPGPSCYSSSLLLRLPDHTEQKRLSWMKDCISWSKLSLLNRRRHKGSVRNGQVLRRSAEASRPPPLCPNTVLQASGWSALQEVTVVALEDLPACSLSTLAQCPQLQSLTLRRCGLRALESINKLTELCYVDVQENNISFVDCKSMTSLKVLRLSHNKLTSIHGLSGAENLDVLDFSHNSVTRIAGLESVRRLQRLSVGHNQLISTKGLRDVYTLLHLDCSHNHLASVEGLENNVLLHSLDLTANCLTEPPRLHNHVLLRELHLDDNSVSSLQGLSACWLPLMQTLTVAQNRVTQLPPMSDFLSLSKLDLRLNCLSDLKNVCDSLEGCQSLLEVHLQGNPLQRESGWRSTLQRVVSSLRTTDGEATDFFLSPSAVQQQVSFASGSFLTFCQVQLQQTRDLQQQHSDELSNASLSLDAVQISCRHFSKALQLAEDQRFAHEYGDITAADEQRAAGQTTSEKTLEEDSSSTGTLVKHPEIEFTGKASPVISNSDNIRCSDWTLEKPVTESHATAAVVIQQQWREYQQKRLDQAATVIQAFWRGFTLRRRLASALAAVTCPDTGEEDTFEVVDVDEFVFDEPPGPPPEATQYICPPPPSGRPKQAWVPSEQMDPAGQRVSSMSSNRGKSPVSASVLSGLSGRSEKILEEWGFTSSHTALLMLKRAQRMKSKKQLHRKGLDSSIRLALFRNCTYQLGPVEAFDQAEVGLHHTEQMRRQRAQEWLQIQNARSDGHSESEHFLPEISSDILNGGRVQLVAEPGYTEHLHQAGGVWASSRLATKPCKENNQLHGKSLGHAKKEFPPPELVTSAPSKKERMSFRDNPVQLSGGWGGGKKRHRVHK
ncbi:leucine-rich repeat- and IQ domain-containing protein 1 [Aulostomus maculatus]